MTTVLAAIDDGPAAASVLRAAQAMGVTLGTDVRAVHVREGSGDSAETAALRVGVPVRTLGGDPVEAIIAAGADPAVTMVVVGARSQRGGKHPAGHVAEAIMVHTAKPVLVVPPDAVLPSAGRVGRILAPLDGSAEASGAVVGTLRRLADAGVDVVAVHVFRPATIPRFWDHAGHAEQNWTAEFLARSSIAPEVTLHLRTGDVAGTALHLAGDEGVDLIVLGWSQDLHGDRARVVRDIVGHATIPVLLAPIT